MELAQELLVSTAAAARVREVQQSAPLVSLAYPVRKISESRRGLTIESAEPQATKQPFTTSSPRHAAVTAKLTSLVFGGRLAAGSVNSFLRPNNDQRAHTSVCSFERDRRLHGDRRHLASCRCRSARASRPERYPFV
jgi:hypothetical protein